ncbi:MAG TPA: lipase maturation factor family protein [Polyangia bacterium]|nr:lipase maturation factor family protein [Polyangia bacterium]
MPPFGERLAPLLRAADRCARNEAGERGNWLTRMVLLRLQGLVYTMAFLTLALQGPALLGPRGLLPIETYLTEVATEAGSRSAGFWLLPSVFWWASGDHAILAAGWAGVALGLVVMAGYANTVVLALLCALQISIVNVGQTFYGFGWEIQLVETGFLCIFLVPLVDGRPFPRRPPPIAVIWLLRWLSVRIMWGAGLIKLRGDPCWRNLTCLDYHFETQPIPNPLTPFFHALPHGVHAVGVAFNHFVELVAPLFVFGTRRMRLFAGASMLALQVILILSGNLAFLNWLTVVPIVACFDDGVWRRLLPRGIIARAEAAAEVAQPSRAQGLTTLTLGVAVALLSVPPVLNMVSGQQVMNSSFTRLPLVNTYGAFGSVGRERNQLVFEGTEDEVVTDATVWRPYAFKCQPVDPARRPCWMSPYHYRLDWLLWFAAMGSPRDHDWTLRLVWNLLGADGPTLALLGDDPFRGHRPRHIRVDLYRYKLAPLGAPTWWQRERLGPWLPPLERDDPELRNYLRASGWPGAEAP